MHLDVYNYNQYFRSVKQIFFRVIIIIFDLPCCFFRSIFVIFICRAKQRMYLQENSKLLSTKKS